MKPKTNKKKAPSKHYLQVDKRTDPSLVDEVVQMMKDENPGDEIIVVYSDKNSTKDLVKSPPSQETSKYWISTVRKKGKYPEPKKNSGKWLIFVDITQIDQTWDEVKLATEDGRLGHASKVSTKKGNVDGKYNKGVICVYTYDWTDKKDVMRIREELRTIGITDRIPYKSDQDTRDKKYIASGHQNISKYFE